MPTLTFPRFGGHLRRRLLEYDDSCLNEYEVTERPERCLKCDSDRVVPVIYGMIWGVDVFDEQGQRPLRECRLAYHFSQSMRTGTANMPSPKLAQVSPS